MTLSSKQLTDSLTLFTMPDGEKVSHQVLKDLLPTAADTLFFAKLFKLNYSQLIELVGITLGRTVLDVLHEDEHSTELQDYIIDVVPDYVREAAAPVFVEKPQDEGILAAFFEMATVTIATSIEQVGEHLKGVVGSLRGKQGSMVFQHLRKMNAQRPGTLGTYEGSIEHGLVADNLVILDVSGSMTEKTVRDVIEPVVGLAWKANAHLVIVSDTATHWEPGAYTVASVLSAAEYEGTHYETLAPLFAGRDWGVVVTIADYDSVWGAKEAIAECDGRIGQVYDLSLVNKPTFLAECVGQLADAVTPLLVGRRNDLWNGF